MTLSDSIRRSKYNKSPGKETDPILPKAQDASPALPDVRAFYTSDMPLGKPLNSKEHEGQNSQCPTDTSTKSKISFKKGKHLWKKLQAKIPDVQLEISESSEPADYDSGLSQRGVSFVDGANRGKSSQSNLAESLSQHLEINIVSCLIAIAVYLTFGAISYSFVFENWSIIDSLYFTVVTFTTVGYGDLSPTSLYGKLFTCVFSLVGISALGIALGVIGNKVVEAQVSSMENAKNESNERVMSFFGEEHVENADLAAKASSNETKGTKNAEQCKKSKLWKTVRKNLYKYTPAAAILILCSFAIGWWEGWDIGQGIYYCIITTTTVGYGDYAPVTAPMRAFAIIFIPVAVGVMGEMLGSVANSVMEIKRNEFMTNLQQREMKLADLIAMDADGDGEVTLLEYVEFMLLSMQKVDKDLLNELHSQFKIIDVDGSGTLQRSDLIEIAKRRLRRADKKLSLSVYKKRLLQQQKRGFQNGGEQTEAAGLV